MVTIAFMASAISAQNSGVDFRDKLQFGLKAGVNYSNVYDSEDQEFNADYKVGFAGGAFLSIPLGKIFGIQPEVLYSEKGFQAKGSFLTIPYEYKHTSTYVDVPLLFALKPSPFLTLLAGPQYSFLVKQKNVFTSGDFTETQEPAIENDKNVICFLGGLDLNMNNLVIGARAGWDLQSNNGDGTTSNPRYKNVWYQATLGIKF